MEYSGAMVPNSTYGNFPNSESDFMEELLFEGCWLESSSGFNFMQSTSNPRSLLLDPSHYMPSFDSSALSQRRQIYNEDDDDNDEQQESSKRVWIGPRAYPNPSSSVKERLMMAVGYLKDCTRDRDVLIQIWVPIRRGGRQMLTTCNQPYSLNPDCKSLANYRAVSSGYHLLTEEDSGESVGLPGRTFLGKLPDWTPDVRFFRSYEYPRVSYAQQYDVRGSLALPIFERGSGSCLGVVEIVMTTQKVNYRPELEYVCQALEVFPLNFLIIYFQSLYFINFFSDIKLVLRATMIIMNKYKF